MKKRISIIIPVLDEAGRINRTLARFSDLLAVGRHQLIVIDGEKSGTTLQAISHSAVIRGISSAGRARQMNRGAAMASGDILLFLHADTLLPPGAIEKVLAALDGPDAAYGAFDLGIDSARRRYRLIEAAVAIRTRIMAMPYGDQAIFVTRALFDAVGGYADIPIMEDLELMRRLRKRGGKPRIIPEKVSTSARRWETEGPVYCTLRNWLLAAAFLLGVRPETLAKYYR